jgi:diguanylate cyclase (GGDEF)-like protein
MQNNAHELLPQENPKNIVIQANHDMLSNLFDQSFKLVMIHIIASLIIVTWWSSVASISSLTLWLAIVTGFCCLGLILKEVYKKYSVPENQRLWLHALALSTALMGSIFGTALVYFTPFDQAEYAISIGLLVFGISSITVITYSASIYVAICFLAPLAIIPSYFLLTIGGATGTATAASIGFYAIIILMLLKNLNTSFKKTIVLTNQVKHEIDKRVLVEQQLQDINRRDGLTGLFNRRYFDEMLEIEIGRSRRNHQPLCVLMIDIDCFKEYNAEYGHIAGDNCLVDVAEMVQALTNRKGDIMARYGGEEFAIILPNIEADGALAFANKLQQEIQRKQIPHTASKLTTLKCVTISVGVSNLRPFSKVDSSELITSADAALYEAKRQGRNRVHLNDNSGLNHGAAL